METSFFSKIFFSLFKEHLLSPEIKQINEDIAKNCETCIKFKRNKPRPVVAPPMASKFNEVVAMDLKVLFKRHKYIIYFIDLFTRFARGAIIKRKLPNHVVESFITTWISTGFGAPKKVLVDNGGEFDNPLFLEAMEQYNIEVCATGANSPWSNGVCERNHCVIDVMIEKMMDEDPNMKLEIALANAISAKNSLYNYNGFSPIQIVTGSLPNLPSCLNKDLPALEKASSGVESHLNAMYLARKAYMKAEASEKICRALKHPVRACEEIFNNGDKVYYKVKGERRWRGPGRVVGQLGTRVLVMHGSRLHRCHVNGVTKVNFVKGINETKDAMNDQKSTSADNISQNKQQNSSSDLVSDSNDSVEERNMVEEKDTSRKSVRERKVPLNYDASSGQWLDKHNNEDTQEVNVVFIPPSRHGDQDVVDAKYSELENWRNMEVVDGVEDRGQKRISARWVITEKQYPDGSKRPKARLVVRGFEEREDIQKDAPTAAKTSLRITFGLACDKGWEIETIDIKAAFLQSQCIEREVYVIPPKYNH